MELLPAQREGSRRWAFDGFIYHKDNKESSIYRCVKRKSPGCCPGYITYDHEGDVCVHCAHIHDADPLGTEKILAREKPLSLACLTKYSFSKIWIYVKNWRCSSRETSPLSSTKSPQNSSGQGINTRE